MIVWGYRRKTSLLGFAAQICPRCHHGVASVANRSTRLTVFFIPLFSMRNETVLRCPNCSFESFVSLDRVQVYPTVDQARRAGSGADRPLMASQVIHPPDETGG
jgi:hypothetical protein